MKSRKIEYRKVFEGSYAEEFTADPEFFIKVMNFYYKTGHVHSPYSPMDRTTSEFGNSMLLMVPRVVTRWLPLFAIRHVVFFRFGVA